MEPPLTSVHVLVGPLLSVLLLALLGWLLWWTYGTHRQHVAPRSDGDDHDLGLLREVAVVPTVEAAEVLRSRLAADGIRATLRPTGDAAGRRILVFAKDEPDARVVLSGLS